MVHLQSVVILLALACGVLGNGLRNIRLKVAAKPFLRAAAGGGAIGLSYGYLLGNTLMRNNGPRHHHVYNLDQDKGDKVEVINAAPGGYGGPLGLGLYGYGR